MSEAESPHAGRFPVAHEPLDLAQIARGLCLSEAQLQGLLPGTFAPGEERTPEQQEHLASFARVLAVLRDVFQGDPERIRQWLLNPHPELQNETPQQTLQTPGGVVGVEQMVTNAWLGIPE